MKRTIFVLVAGLTSSSLLGSGAHFAPAGSDSDVVGHELQDPQTTQRPQELVLMLTSPGSHPKIGVPSFAAMGGAAAAEAAGTMADVLWADLEYEREYYMISRKASASIPEASTPEALPFAQWTQLGADFVLLGAVKESGGKVTVEIKLVSVRPDSQGKQAFGQTYDGCTLANPRFCAHYIADDMHKRLRNLDGIARTRIAFASDRDPALTTGRPEAGQSKEIYVMDYDGAGVRRMTATKGLSVGPAWGPDGRTLAYVSWATSYPDVYLSTLDGRPPTRPAQGNEVVHNWSPVISPDGTRIAFVSNRAGQGFMDIWVAGRDGSNARNLTPNTDKSQEGAPTWSPGGNQIAFTSDRTGLNQIYLMSTDGTGVTRLTFDKHVDRPTWSALGFIAYTLRQPAGHDIAVIDLSNRTPRVITDGLGSNKQPTVAPNGRHIVFVTTRWGKEHLASIDADGKNIRRLTDAGNNTYPSWSPAPGGR